MTGEKNRYKTHEQLWKLEDGDLSTPQHDELILQLLYKQNAKKLMYMCYPYDFVGLDGYEDIDDSRIEVESEVPICINKDFIVGYIDIVIRYNFPDSPPRVLYVEVKPKIKSFGDTLRQLKTYQMYRPFNYILYTPDTTFQEAFKTQGFCVVTPEILGLK